MAFEITDNNSFVSYKKVDNLFTVKLRKDGIMEVEWHTGSNDITISDLKELRDTIGELGEGKKYPVYTSTHDFMSITPEARSFSVTEESYTFTKANAILIDNMAKRIFFNLYLRLNNPKVPIKGFANKTAALLWLKQFAI